MTSEILIEANFESGEDIVFGSSVCPLVQAMVLQFNVWISNGKIAYTFSPCGIMHLRKIRFYIKMLYVLYLEKYSRRTAAYNFDFQLPVFICHIFYI